MIRSFKTWGFDKGLYENSFLACGYFKYSTCTDLTNCKLGCFKVKVPTDVYEDVKVEMYAESIGCREWDIERIYNQLTDQYELNTKDCNRCFEELLEMDLGPLARASGIFVELFEIAARYMNGD